VGRGEGSDVRANDGSGSEPVSTPVTLLAAAAVASTVSVLLWLPDTLSSHILGYVLSTFITLGLLAAYKRQDLKARQSPFFSPRSGTSTVGLAVTIVAVAGAMAHVWVIATFWAG
jgi:hypothetical protein